MSKSRVRLALVASVACTRPPVSRQSSQVSTVPKASRPAAAAARAPGTLSSSQASLVAEKYGIEQQAGARGDQRLVAGLAQRGAGGGGAAVLPDDGVVDRLAGGAVPDQRGLALVGDADGRDVGGGGAGAGERLAQRLDAVGDRFPRRRARPSRRRGSAA